MLRCGFAARCAESLRLSGTAEKVMRLCLEKLEAQPQENKRHWGRKGKAFPHLKRPSREPYSSLFEKRTRQSAADRLNLHHPRKALAGPWRPLWRAKLTCASTRHKTEIAIQ